MKKILLIVLCLLVSCNYVYADITDVLYEVSADSKTTSSNVQDFLSKNHYNFEMPYSTAEKTGFYLKASTASEYELIQVFANGNKTYLYFLNNSKSLDCKDALIEQLGCNYTKLKDKNLLAEFKDEALTTKSNFDRRDLAKPQGNITYDFSDEAQQKYDADKKAQSLCPVKVYTPTVEKSKKQKTFISTPAKPANNPPVTIYKSDSTTSKTLKGAIMCVPSGAFMDASLQSTIDSTSLEKDDKITASLNKDFFYKGLLVAPAGSILYGKASQVVHPGYAYGNGALEVTFYQILTPKGTQINISTEKISLSTESKRAANISRNVLIGAGIGALTGLLSGDSSYIAKGALIGATGGGIRAVAHKGENVSIKSGLPLQIKLSQPLNISVYD